MEQKASDNPFYKKIFLIAHTKELSALSLGAELLTLASHVPRLCVTFVPSLTGLCIKNSVKQEALRPLRFSQVEGGR